MTRFLYHAAVQGVEQQGQEDQEGCHRKKRGQHALLELVEVGGPGDVLTFTGQRPHAKVNRRKTAQQVAQGQHGGASGSDSLLAEPRVGGVLEIGRFAAYSLPVLGLLWSLWRRKRLDAPRA